MVYPYPYDTLPRVSRREVTLIEGLHRNDKLWTRWSQELEKGLGADLQARLAYLGADRPREPAVGAGWVGSLLDESSSEVAWVHIDVSMAQALAALVLKGALPPVIEMRPLLEVESEALGVLLSYLCSRTGARLQSRPTRVLFRGHDPSDSMGHVRLWLELEHCGGFVTLWITDRAWSVLSECNGLEGCTAGDALSVSALWHRHERPARLCLARFHCSMIELLDLEVGDVLLPAAWLDCGAPGRCVLLFGRHRVAVGVIGRGGALTFTFTGWGDDVDNGKGNEDSQENIRTAVNVAEIHDEVQADVVEDLERTAEIPAQVIDLVVGRLDMTLADLAALRPGRVLTLATVVNEPIELVTGDRTIGRGELVEVEGRLGVRIISMD